MDIVVKPGVTWTHNSNEAGGPVLACGKELSMCLEFSEWSWKSRAADLARKEREAAEAQKKQQSEPTPPAQPAAPETPIKERETVPV
jgi:hypothetical protein